MMTTVTVECARPLTWYKRMTTMTLARTRYATPNITRVGGARHALKPGLRSKRTRWRL
jgi:hypothetical protein